MSDVGKLKLGKQEVELPIVIGTEDEPAIDISRLRSQTGFITLDDGYVTPAPRPALSRFSTAKRGCFAIAAIRSKCSPSESDFVEVSYLLIYGELPTPDAVGRISQFAAAAHDAARGHAVVLQRLAAQRASRWPRSVRWSARCRPSIKIRSTRTTRDRSRFPSIV